MYVYQKPDTLLSASRERAHLNCTAFRWNVHSLFLNSSHCLWCRFSVTNCTGCTSVKLILIVAINVNEFLVNSSWHFGSCSNYTFTRFHFLSCFFFSWFTMKDSHAACIYTLTINTADLLWYTKSWNLLFALKSGRLFLPVKWAARATQGGYLTEVGVSHTYASKIHAMIWHKKKTLTFFIFRF